MWPRTTYCVTLIRVSVPAVFILPPHHDSLCPTSIDRRPVLYDDDNAVLRTQFHVR